MLLYSWNLRYYTKKQLEKTSKERWAISKFASDRCKAWDG